MSGALLPLGTTLGCTLSRSLCDRAMMVHIDPGHARVYLRVMPLVVLQAVAGYGAVGQLSSVSAFISQQRCSLLPQWVSLPHCSRSTSRQEKPWRQTALMALTPLKEVEELPKDETHSIWGSWKEFSYPGSRPSKRASKTFDEFSKKTGGAWKTRYLGMFPVNMMSAPYTLSWLKDAERKNKLTTSWPRSFMRIAGDKCVLASDLSSRDHDDMRQLFLEAIGPAAVLSVQPLVEFHLDKYMKVFEGYAKTGEQFKLNPILQDIFLDITAGCFLGEITPAELDLIRVEFRVMISAMFSIPHELPWPLSRTPLAKIRPFNMGSGLDARGKVAKTISSFVERRRQQLSSADGHESRYVVDKMLEKQANKQANGRPTPGELEIDTDYMLDNLIASLIAGQGSTSQVISRIVQILGAPESKNIAERVLDEVLTSKLKVGSEAAGGLLVNFPHLRSLMLEAARVYPSSSAGWRKPKDDLDFNGYRISKNSDVLWSFLPIAMSEEHYPEPEKICPLRFLNNKQSTSSIGEKTGAMRTPEEAGQPMPPMFGFGKHYCPGRELSKMAIILFVRKFYKEFDVHVTQGQDFTGLFPENQPTDGLLLSLSKKTKASSLG